VKFYEGGLSMEYAEKASLWRLRGYQSRAERIIRDMKNEANK
jgi:hypothetical protein